MRLYEFDDTEQYVSKIIAITGQLQNELNSGKIETNWTVNDLIDYFQQYDVVLDPKDLYNMIQKPPLKKLITNIQGDKVIFKGQQQSPAVDAPPKDDKKVVAQMAKRAIDI